MNTLTPELQRSEKTAQLMWTAFILMFFVIQAIIWTIAISFTARDASHAVVEGYDEQALRWDEVKELRAASARLGWQTEIEVAPDGDIMGNRVVTVTVSDDSKTPLENASLTLTAFHRGRASERQELSFVSAGAGVFRGNLVVRKRGTWQFSGSVKDAGNEFLIEQRIDLDANRGL